MPIPARVLSPESQEESGVSPEDSEHADTHQRSPQQARLRKVRSLRASSGLEAVSQEIPLVIHPGLFSAARRLWN